MPAVARKPGAWAVLALFALVYAPTAVWFVERWSMGVWWHVHGFLVFPLAIWLAWSRLRSLPPQPPSSSAWGFAFLVPAALLQVLDAMLGFEILSAVSMLLAICGLALLLLGKKRARAIWFPLLFLGFAVPIPLFVARPVHLALRGIAAASTEAVLGGLGYDVHREGFNLSVGPEKLEVADACSGFSALMAMLMVGLLLAYLSKARAWRGGLLVLWVVPAAIAANVARCILLSMLIAAFGGGILHTAIHPISGMFTFVAALALVLVVDRLLLIAPKPEVAPC
ncbi:MAG TPA: exosortase/archaeosortase family protein [Planctomycetota bacterium]|nr:exosortase/archaeosortase family protein [Planctomycetota bacterium]